MDVDQQLRETVRKISRQSANHISFHYPLEERIRQKAARYTQRRMRRSWMAVVSVTAAVIIGFLVWQSALMNSVPTTMSSNSEAVEQPLMKRVEQALTPMFQAVPELKTYQLSIKNSPDDWVLAELTGQGNTRATVYVNEESGELEQFNWFTAEDRDHAPSLRVAKEKAENFVHILAGDNYMLSDAHEIRKPEFGFMKLDITGINVTFREQSSSPQRHTDLSVWVDGSGRIVAYNRLIPAEQALIDQLGGFIPQMDSSLVLENKNISANERSLTFSSKESPGKIMMVASQEKGTALTGYSIEQAGETSVIKAPSQALAVKQANQFLDQVLQQDRKNYQIVNFEQDVQYIRYYKGLPVLGDTIHVTVNSGGEVTQFRKDAAYYRLADLPDPSKALSLTDAKAKLVSQMKLRYIEQPSTGQSQPFLDYTPAVGETYNRYSSMTLPFWYIDAVSGEMQYSYGNNGFDYDGLIASRGVQTISMDGKEPASIVRNSYDAQKLLEEQAGSPLKGLAYSCNKDASNHLIQYSWEEANGRRYRLTVDNYTGQVREILIPRAPNTRLVVTEQQASDEALRFLKKWIDPEVNEVQLSQIASPAVPSPVASGDWEFEYVRSYKGIPVLSDKANEAYIVTVDPYTGKANGFINRRSIREHSLLPEPKGTATVQEATETYLQYRPLMLAYALSNRNGDQTGPRLVYLSQTVSLYSGKQINIDALTGKAIVQ
ncbi:hypothetical protein NS115_12845 [Paenibacillus jamilae]|uniref:Uncharacterized protein n=1 Tax=Paenibacillus jamilae TaxID=114136 RepID=A0ACC4ZUQ6_9BACL|nr:MULTISPECIES: YcdB/YcdC domain-containing protein [Paenibacillus]AUO07143.1 hypothetical protein C0638_11625 [Paenibacillus sp. lzh-N1]KTS82229.1 hypothetical protein NS115_12845 [Paenibacillus jamilae]